MLKIEKVIFLSVFLATAGICASDPVMLKIATEDGTFSHSFELASDAKVCILDSGDNNLEQIYPSMNQSNGSAPTDDNTVMPSLVGGDSGIAPETPAVEKTEAEATPAQAS